MLRGRKWRRWNVVAVTNAQHRCEVQENVATRRLGKHAFNKLRSLIFEILTAVLMSIEVF
jgi:hypothetical protein